MIIDPSPPLISIGPRVRKSPYFDATRRYGAKAFTIYNHMYMPTSYSDPVAEYWSLVNDVTLWDVACQRQVEISGPDASALVQLLTPRDMSKCDVGQCQYMLLTDSNGGIVNDAVLLRVGADTFWLSPGDGDVLLWVSGVASQSDFDVVVSEPDVSPLQLQGPKSPYVAREIFGDGILDLRYYRMIETVLDDIPLVVSRTGWSGELGYELYLRDARCGDALWERVMTAGREFDIAPIAPNLIRSIEGGLLSYRSDITANDNPFVIGMDNMVDFDQADEFIGKKALQVIAASGVTRRLVGIEIGGEPLPASNSQFYPLTDGNEAVGYLTRCAYSPRLEKNIGYANIDAAHAGLGECLTLRCPAGVREVIVSAAPWMPSQKNLPTELRKLRVQAESV